MELCNNVTIICEDYGVPTPIITWARNGLPIPEPSFYFSSAVSLNRTSGYVIGSLLINRVQYLHRGLYECTAKNEAGNDATTASVIVHYEGITLNL